MAMHLNGLMQSIAIICATTSSFAQESVTLSKDDAELARAIMKKDQFIRELALSDKSLKDLNVLLKLTAGNIPGPVKLVIKWNQNLIEGWRKANSNIAKIGAKAICNDIQLASITAENREFFEEMFEARGCDDF